MAEAVEDTSPPRRRTFYPWHDWTDGRKWRAKQGVDFSVSILSFQNALHQRARAKQLVVSTGSPEPGIVEFQFFTKKSPNVE
jgi:hypothetical protein